MRLQVKKYGLNLVILSVFSILYLLTFLQTDRRQSCNLKQDGNMLTPFFYDSSEPLLSSMLTGKGSSAIFNNALVAGNSKVRKGFITLGIPTVSRQKGHSYLIETIESLVNNTNEVERTNIRLLVFLADSNETARMEVKTSLLDKFDHLLEQGVMFIIQPPTEFYPSFDHLPRTYKHTVGKVKWRAKQNYDYAYMMLFAMGMSEYYLQLEDDLTTVPDYIKIIKDFIYKNKRTGWTCLEFSSLGFIAKLYHSYDLEKLAKMLILFFYEQPNDFTYIIFNQMKLQEHRIVRKPTIFKHQGIHSSLSEKKEVRVDPLFQEVNSLYPTGQANVSTVLNPHARITTDLKIYENHQPIRCYVNKDIIWTLGPKQGSRLTILFGTPQPLHSVKVVTGPDDHPDDFLQHGVVQVGQKAVSLSNRIADCVDVFALQKFTLGQVNMVLDDESRSIPAACVQIFVTATQTNWLMISEISVRAIKP